MAFTTQVAGRPEVARAPLIFAHRFGRWDLTRTPRVVGVLNVTPDSFSDGGRFFGVDDAVSHARRMVEEGADALDVGGQSTRPGAGEPVGAEEEWARIGPVLAELARRFPDVPLSADTYQAEVARRALAEGAAMINDVTGLLHDGAQMAEIVAATGAGIVLMHSRGGPRGFHARSEYEDLVGEVRWSLYASMREALMRGVRDEAIAVDPGIGFSKRPAQSIEVLRGLPRLTDLGRPLYIGVSRKSFLGTLTGEPVDERLAAGLGATAAAYALGGRIFRTHDVKATRDALTLAEAMLGEGPAAMPEATPVAGAPKEKRA